MKHKEVFTLPNAKLCLKKKIPLEEILYVTEFQIYHRILSFIPLPETTFLLS